MAPKSKKSTGMTNPRQRKNPVVSQAVGVNQSSSRSSVNGLRFKEVERFTGVYSTGSDGVSAFQVNPGLASMFPWLSGIATSFEKYKVHSLTFRYKNIQGSNASGNVVMAFDYDPLDVTPASPQECTKSSTYIDGAVWRIFELKIPNLSKDLYVRQSVVPGTDLKTYDYGQLFVAMEGAPVATLGYIEVEYDIELFMRQAAIGLSGISSAYISTVQGNLTIGNIPELKVLSSTSVSLPAGTYIINAGANPVTTVTTPGNITGFATAPAGGVRFFRTTATITLGSSTATDVVILRI